MPRGLFQVKAIRPRKKNSRLHFGELRRELENQGGIAKRMYEKTVRTWREKPKFSARFAIGRSPGPRGGATSRGAYVFVTYDGRTKGGKRFTWTDEGTRPHTITPRKPGGLLSFQPDFSPKTRPGVIGSRAGGSKGEFVHAKEVQHPGTKARQFTREIAKRRRRYFYKQMAEANRRGLKKAGYSGAP